LGWIVRAGAAAFQTDFFGSGESGIYQIAGGGSAAVRYTGFFSSICKRSPVGRDPLPGTDGGITIGIVITVGDGTIGAAGIQYHLVIPGPSGFEAAFVVKNSGKDPYGDIVSRSSGFENLAHIIRRPIDRAAAGVAGARGRGKRGEFGVVAAAGHRHGGDKRAGAEDALEVEVLFLARKKGYSIKEVPVTWTFVKTMRLNFFQNSYKMARDVLKITINDLKGVYRV